MSRFLTVLGILVLPRFLLPREWPPPLLPGLPTAGRAKGREPQCSPRGPLNLGHGSRQSLERGRAVTNAGRRFRLGRRKAGTALAFIFTSVSPPSPLAGCSQLTEPQRGSEALTMFPAALDSGLAESRSQI